VDRIEVTYLDAHVVVWLYAGDVAKMSKAAAEQIQNDELLVSPAVILELQFLHEIKRLKPTASSVMTTLAKDIGLRVCELSFMAVVESAADQKWVRDPFDRLIVG
jgi:PIN domain nuclease of toxin-antitoxin system